MARTVTLEGKIDAVYMRSDSYGHSSLSVAIITPQNGIEIANYSGKREEIGALYQVLEKRAGADVIIEKKVGFDMTYKYPVFCAVKDGAEVQNGFK